MIYTHVSTEAQAENGTNVDVQRHAWLTIAQTAGTLAVTVLPDLGASGTRYSRRPGIGGPVAKSI